MYKTDPAQIYLFQLGYHLTVHKTDALENIYCSNETRAV